MKFMENIGIFFKRTETYIKNINRLKWSYFITLIALFLAVKTGFNVISSHNFPPELSFDKTGIINPTVIEYLLSAIISLLLNFLIFIPSLILNIKTGERILKFFIINIAGIIIFALPFFIKSKIVFLSFLIFVTVAAIIYISRDREEYTILLKIMISLSIISIISEPFMFLAQKLENESLYTVLNLAFAIIYIYFFIKIIKLKYDLSINRILLYSISSSILAFLFGFIMYKSMIFNSNIMKLMLYQ